MARQKNNSVWANSHSPIHPKIYIRTFGCQMNVADSEKMAGVLAQSGYELTKDEESADIVLLNTSSVRAHAEEKVFSKLGELSKKKSKGLVIGVTGCMAQRYGQGLFKRAPYVDLVCGTYRFHKIGDLLKAASGGKAVDIECIEDDMQDKEYAMHAGSVCAYLPIMRGCNNKCSYCIVPYVRGPERSRSLDEIISEVCALADKGVKEVTLLGQNVNSYRSRNQGKQKPEISNQKPETSNQKPEIRNQKPEIRNQMEKIDFVGLLRKVNEIDGIERIRFVTSHPKDASKELFRAVRELGKVCEHLHLPVQSGSNNILEKMNREYTREHYLDLVSGLTGISVSTDIIVGFPDETEEDFRDTVELMEEIKFDSAFIFKYSARPGTLADRLKDNIPQEIKRERNQRLLKLQEEISLSKNKELIGHDVEVLVEGLSESNKDRLRGRTRANKIVVFHGTADMTGRLIRVKIIDATAHTLYGCSVDVS